MKEATSAEIFLTDGKKIFGDLIQPKVCEGVILFAHGSGSSRKSPRNQLVAAALQNNNYATLLMDLLTEEEAQKRENVFDCELLANRLSDVVLWIKTRPGLAELPLAVFGASTGAGGAVIAAAQWPHQFQALISRGGRPDLAKEYLPRVRQPTLFIVGGRDELVLKLNHLAFEKLNCKKKLEILPGATHLFEEPGKLEEVAQLSVEFLDQNMKAYPVPFENREGAGWVLAQRFKGRRFVNPIVVAIPRGGIILGSILAKELHADLDVTVSRKLRHPDFPELAIGAVSETGEWVLTDEGRRIESQDRKQINNEKKRQKREIEKRTKSFRHFFPKGVVQGRTVILTDDGIATGSTILASIKAIRNQKPKEIIVATPVAPPESLEGLRKECEEIVCLATPTPFRAVGEFYRNFEQVDDSLFLQKLKTWATQQAARLK